MTNVDTRAQAFLNRLTKLEQEKRNLSEDIKDLSKEMKGVGMSADEIAGVKLAVRRSFETDEKRAKRETVEEFAASLGDFADLPMGRAAVARHSFDG
jgi:uncharacterized protein (UPF0335 family)